MTKVNCLKTMKLFLFLQKVIGLFVVKNGHAYETGT